MDASCLPHLLHASGPTLPNAAQAGLRADRDYLALLEAESTWPTRYVLSAPQPLQVRRYPIQGLNRPAIGPEQIDAFNSLLPVNFRVQTRASQNRPQTELFGTAPYLALGRGVAQHVDVSTALLQGNPLFDRGNRVLEERPWPREQFVTVPAELRDLPVDTRLGEVTRLAPEYQKQPRDP